MYQPCLARRLLLTRGTNNDLFISRAPTEHEVEEAFVIGSKHSLSIDNEDDGDTPGPSEIRQSSKKQHHT